MSDPKDSKKADPKPAKKDEKPDEPVKPEGLTDEEFAALREDVRKMGSPEPEETR